MMHMQVIQALHASPLSAEAAVAAGLITGMRHRTEAMQTILHNPQVGGHPAASLSPGCTFSLATGLTASERFSDIEGPENWSAFYEAWKHEGRVARYDASSTAKVGASLSQAQHSAGADAVQGAGSQSRTGAASNHDNDVLARLDESSLAGKRGPRIRVIEDMVDGCALQTISTVRLSEYIKVSPSLQSQPFCVTWACTMHVPAMHWQCQ